MKANTPRFNVESYRSGRPLYPRVIFQLLEREFKIEQGLFLDLGCGTGQSTRSFLSLGKTHRGFAVEPDTEMLEEARLAYGDQFPDVSFLSGAAEAIPLPDTSVDLVLVGSALHWFQPEKAREEIERTLRPGGILFVYEYQFPKCIDDPELAETVRRRWNLEWKAPIQRPRGTLADLLAPYRESGNWVVLGDERPPWKESLSLDGFLGHLFSQSRYIHSEKLQSDTTQYRLKTAAAFEPFFRNGPRLFDLKPRAIGLKKAQ